jgi:hypothetical protein
MGLRSWAQTTHSLYHSNLIKRLYRDTYIGSNLMQFLSIVQHQGHPMFCQPPCLGRFLDIIGQNPSVSKSNELHVVIL